MNIYLIDIYHEFHFEILKQLQNENKELSFPYVIGGTEQNFHGNIQNIEKIKREIFDKNTKFEEVINFIFPKKIIEFIAEEWTLSREIVMGMKEAEAYFLRLTDRNSVFPISVQERRQFYLLLLNYFNSMMSKKNVDYVLTFDTPHSYSSNLFYKIAEFYKIPLLRLEHHFLQNHSLLLSYHNPALPIEYYNEFTKEELYNKLPEKIKQDLVQYNTMIHNANRNEKRALIGSSGLSSIKLILRYIVKASQNLIMGIFPFFFKKEILHFTSLNQIKSRLIYRVKINKPLFNLIRLNHYYNKISETPDLTEKYVFFGMHMQPEKTSQPLGGEFDHQLLPITILSNSVPEGWFVYVKEHPNQFNKKKIANNNYRSKEFYQALIKLKNVKLVSLEVPSVDLISNAQIVSTLTGTMGWEALTKGKPVLAFGNSYYKACRAVGSPTSVEECKKEIERLLGLTPDDIEKEIYRYLLYYSENEYLVEASNWEETLSFNALSREKQINNIAKSINKRLFALKENYR